MIGLDSFLSRLSKVKKLGAGRYMACCPAHDDKNPSLLVTELDGKIRVWCFAGCNFMDVFSSIGIEPSDLYPDKKLKSSYTGKPARFNAYDILRCLKTEAGIITLAASDCAKQGIYRVRSQ